MLIIITTIVIIIAGSWSLWLMLRSLKALQWKKECLLRLLLLLL